MFAPGEQAIKGSNGNAPHRSFHILVAEDNAVNQMVILKLLAKLGHQGEIAPNGKKAVEAARGGTYDAILMDCHMPEMDGFEATSEIRRSGNEIPIIALTANAMKGDAEKCLASGMNAYMSKPVDLAKLAQELNRWTSRAQVVEVNPPVNA